MPGLHIDEVGDGNPSLQDIHDSDKGTNNYSKNLYVDDGGDYFDMGIDEDGGSWFDFWGDEGYADFFGAGGGLSLGFYQSSPALSWYGYGTTGDEDTMILARSGQIEIQATNYNFFNGELVSSSVSLEEGVIEFSTFIKNRGDQTFSLKTPALNKIIGASCNLDFPYKSGNWIVPLTVNGVEADPDGNIVIAPKRLKNQTLTAANWIFNAATGLYEYDFAHEQITLLSNIEFIPLKESIPTVIQSVVQPYTTIIVGISTIYAENLPNQDIAVDVIIQQVKDV